MAISDVSGAKAGKKQDRKSLELNKRGIAQQRVLLSGAWGRKKNRLERGGTLDGENPGLNMNRVDGRGTVANPPAHSKEGVRRVKRGKKHIESPWLRWERDRRSHNNTMQKSILRGGQYKTGDMKQPGGVYVTRLGAKMFSGKRAI